MLRTPFASERIQRVDPLTGIKVIQITSYPTPSLPLEYQWPSIAPDGYRLVFMSQRTADRVAPWDLFLCDTDGLNLFQLTKRDESKFPAHFNKLNAPLPILSLDGRTLYVIWNGYPVLYAVDLENGSIEDVCSIESVCPQGTIFQHIRISAAGDRLYVVFRSPSIGTVRVDLETGESTKLELDGFLWACMAKERRIIVLKNTATEGDALPDYISFARASGERTLWSLDEDGADPRFHSPDRFSHASMLGGSDCIQGCGLSPDRSIWFAQEGEPPRKLCNGPYFWHSGPSWDGEWIVAGTNWPDEGLKLIHAPTGHFRTLCHAGATQEHVRAGHPHPGLSHDGRIAVFASDRTGVAQVYVAFITDEFRESVIAGVLDMPNDKRLVN